MRPFLYNKKNVCPTSSPTASQGPFSIYAEGERCLEGRLAPFSSRRERALIQQSAAPAYVSASQATDKVFAQESPFATPYDCWYYCSVNGGAPVPFYFNWNVQTRDCYCCGTCVRDVGYCGIC